MKDDFSINNAPEGTWVERKEDRVIIGSTLRNSTMAISFILPLFILSLSAGYLFYTQFLFSGIVGKVFISILLIPFSLAIIYFIKHSLLTLFGKIEISLGYSEGIFFEGIYLLGKTSTFEFSNVEFIKEIETSRVNKIPVYAILLKGQDINIILGKYLSEPRRNFVLNSIQQLMYDGDNIRKTLEPDLIKHLIS